MKVTDLPAAPSLQEYRGIIGEERIAALEGLADRLAGVTFQEINSTRSGGGVAEILNSYIPFLRALGLETTWSVMEADAPFFDVTKTLHNFLQGRDGFSPSMIEVYWETLRKNEGLIDDDADVVTIHDPQPLGLIEYATRDDLERKRFIWRCHVQLETLSVDTVSEIGRFMKKLVEQYHASVFSSMQYLPLWQVPSFIIPPFIDPLSEKNRDLTEQEINGVLAKVRHRDGNAAYHPGLAIRYLQRPCRCHRGFSKGQREGSLPAASRRRTGVRRPRVFPRPAECQGGRGGSSRHPHSGSPLGQSLGDQRPAESLCDHRAEVAKRGVRPHRLGRFLERQARRRR